jgi:hypothetical protein
VHAMSDLRTHHKPLLKSSKDAHRLGISEYVFSIFSINELAVCMQKYSPGIAWGALGALLSVTREGPHGVGRSVAHSMWKNEGKRIVCCASP